MTADTLKSTSITNLDANPIVANTAGVGASAFSKVQMDFVTPTTGGLVSTSSIYKILRLPTHAFLQGLKLTADSALETNGTPALAVDVGAYYSDSTTDGTPAANQGNSISVNCFAAALLYGAAGNFAEINVLGSLSVAKRMQPLWQAAGLSSDPGGMIDIVVAVHTAAGTAASAKMALRAEYVY